MSEYQYYEFQAIDRPLGEADIARRNASGYDRASALLFDLETIATEDGTLADFTNRLDAVRGRHARKKQFLERLKGLGER